MCASALVVLASVLLLQRLHWLCLCSGLQACTEERAGEGTEQESASVCELLSLGCARLLGMCIAAAAALVVLCFLSSF
jgi:hypothetical protein